MHDRNQTIVAFLNATAEKTPTPGGGSVAALAGALAAAMGEMVLNFSVGKKDLLQYDVQLKESLAAFTRARHMLLELMEEDQAGYEALREIRKLPADSAERKDREPVAIATCVRIPQAIAATALAVLETCDRLPKMVNKYLLCDFAVCADIAMATLRGGIYCVRVNLPELKDAPDRASLDESIARMLIRGTTIMRTLIPAIWARVESGT